MAYKLGIIGFGGMAGGYHVDTVLREDIPFEPVAAYDINPDRLAYAKQRGLAARARGIRQSRRFLRTRRRI